MLNEMMKFDLPQDQNSIIKVIGVGGGGSNAVNHMYNQGIKGVEFIVCNTDQQALDISPVPVKIQLGSSLTEGRGAGSIPEVGKNAAIENINDLKDILKKNTKMAFITAGMGGGTGTGAAPIIAAAAREMGILTVGIVTVPFAFEGKKRRNQAIEGLEELRQNVDTLLVISNDKLREMHGNRPLKEAFAQADDVLTTAAKGIAEIITVTGLINVDFNDVYTVMKDGGSAIMGASTAEGENRAIRAAEHALSSPLLNDNNIKGASQVLLYITGGAAEVTMDEVGDISDYIQGEAGDTANIIMGTGTDESLGDKISVIIIATGFDSKMDIGVEAPKRADKIVHQLSESSASVQPVAIAPIITPVEPPAPPTPVIEEPVLIIRNPEPELKPKAEEQQVSIEFEIVKKTFEPVVNRINTPLENITSHVESNNTNSDFTSEEQMKKANERIMKLKNLSFKMRTPNGLNELENEPAYKRRNIQLSSVPHSSESAISRFTLSTDGEDSKPEIKPNNSFLHDQVD